jgi:CRP/FNR family cyclic AMP-dependent transcriptional regulator
MGEIAKNFDDLPERHFAAGEVLITEGTCAGGLFFLLSGTVSVTKEGVEIHKISAKGAIFGEMSYLLDCPATATVTAHEPCAVKFVSDREEFIRKHPETALYIARILALRLNSVVGYLVDLKAQFKDHQDHFGMMDEILDSIINKHPRSIEKELGERDQVED